MVRQNWVIGLMGLVSAHDEIPQRAMRTGEFHNLAGDIITGTNSGIAIVTPATEIKELLMREDVVKDRDLRRSQKAPALEHMPTLDMNRGTAAEMPFRKSDFEKALKRASQKTSEPESKKTQTSE